MRVAEPAPGDRAERAWREGARRGAAALVLLALAIFGTRLALAPIHGVRSAGACARALAAARTRADTVSADMLSYPDSAGRRRPCGRLRTVTVDLTRR